MSYRLSVVVVAAAVAWGVPACAGQWSLGESSRSAATFEHRTGNVTETDLFVRLPRVLAQHGYFIVEGEEHGRRYRFDTQWKYREPFPDEEERGIVEARTRIRVRAQFREEWGAAMYAMRLEVENMVRSSAGGWRHAPASDDFERHAGEIAREVRATIASGMRRF
ncbi:MAG: hypothetical protein ACODAB_10300 [Gemmatimonadota bacterium]